MSGYMQLVPPRTGTKDTAGRCLPFAQSFFGAPIRHDYARQSFAASSYIHLDWYPPADAASLLWFDHWGTYYSYSKGRYEYVNAGHVAILVPGIGIFTSPAYARYVNGYEVPQQEIYQTIAAIERTFGATYIGWTEDINGLRVIQPKPAPQPPKPIPPVVPPKKWKANMEMYRPKFEHQQTLKGSDEFQHIYINAENWVTIAQEPDVYDVAIGVNLTGPVDALVEIGLRLETIDNASGVIQENGTRFVLSETRKLHAGENKITLSSPVPIPKAPGKNQSTRLRIVAKTNIAGVKVVQVRNNVARKV